MYPQIYRLNVVSEPTVLIKHIYLSNDNRRLSGRSRKINSASPSMGKPPIVVNEVE